MKPSRSFRQPLWLAICFCALGCGAVLELLNLTAGVRAGQAARALNEGQPLAGRARAEQALRSNPWHERAAFTRCMAIRALGNAAQTAECAEALTRWHPQRPLLQLIAGEAWLTVGQPERAAGNLWGGLWATPIPSQSPTIFWWETWQASARSKAAGVGPARAARHMARTVLPNDRTLAPEMREAIRRELE